MPVLQNPRHERFVQLIIEGARHGGSQAEAYVKAGYQAKGNGAEVNASKLLRQTKIQQRLAELAEPAARKAKITVESLLTQLDAALAGAMGAKQYGAANGSLALMGKLTGLLRDRLEVGEPGSFDKLETPADVALKMLNECGGLEEALAGLDKLREALMSVASSMAVDVTSAAAVLVPGAETARAMAVLRPAQRMGRN